jgi:hypothetical protein
MMLPIAALLFAVGYAMQMVIINPFISRPEHSQFMLMVAIAIIIVNSLLMIFGPDAQAVQTSYSFDSYALGPVIVDATKLYAGLAALWWPLRCSPSSSTRRSARRSAPAPTITPAHWWWASTSSSSMRCRSALARPASVPPAPSSC